MRYQQQSQKQVTETGMMVCPYLTNWLASPLEGDHGMFIFKMLNYKCRLNKVTSI